MNALNPSLVGLLISRNSPRTPPQTRDAPNTPAVGPWTRCPLAHPIRRCGNSWSESRDGADGARLAKLLDVGAVEGSGAVELQRHSFDVDA